MFAILTFLFFLIQKALCQSAAIEHKELQIDTPDVEKIDKENGMFYYKLTIPSSTPINTFNLAVRVKENDEADSSGEDFSDPDIYISKANLYPNDPSNSTWYAERFGEDLLTIPKSFVTPGETFYLGVLCERRCKFEILAKLSDTYTLDDDGVYQAYVPKELSVVFTFKSRAKAFSELEFIAFSEQLGFFRIYVGKEEMPSDQKSITAIPSWAGGFSVNINQGSKDYCTDCTYYLVLEAPVTDVTVYLFARYEETVTEVRAAEPIISSLRPYKTHCYKTPVEERFKDENLILQVSLFSGSATLKVQPWALPTKDSDEFVILSERVIKYSKEDREEYSKSNSDESDFYFCLTAEEFTSYIIKAVFESQVEDAQKLNMLYKNKEIDGFLPGNKAVRYRVLDFESQANITLTLNVKSGDPKLYGYICEDIKFCKFTKSRVQQELVNDKMIMAQEYAIGYKVTIENSINTCHAKRKEESEADSSSMVNSLSCAVLAVVVCEGEEDCEYSIRTSRDNSILQLTPRKPHFQVIPYKEVDMYLIKIEDESISTLNVVLNSITGDADMKVFYLDTINNSAEQKLIGVSENEPFIPDVVRVRNDTINKPNLVGHYFVNVIGDSFASYSLYYYTIRKSEPINISLDLQTGHIVRDVFKRETKFKVYSYNPRMKEDLDIRVTITPEVSQYAIYAFLNIDDLKYSEENSYNPISGHLWKSTLENELIIKKTDANYKRNEIYYFVIVKTYEESNSNATPSFYIGVTNEDYPFMLYESVPHLVTLTKSLDSQTYWYTHPNISDAFSLSVNVYYGRVSVMVDFKEVVNNKTNAAAKALDVETTYLTITPEVLKQNCKENNCGIFIRVEKTSEYEAQYLLTAKSQMNKPDLLSAGVLKYETISPGEVRKYYVLLEKKSNSVIFVSCTDGFVEAYVNVQQAITNPNKATYPTEDKFDYSATDTNYGKLVNLDHKVFDNCDPCQVLISVYGRKLDFAESQISFSVAYYDQARRLNQNQPLKGHIAKGEFQFYRVYFGSPSDVFLSLSNMDGDVDLYVNYGKELPHFENYTWVSNTLSNEFIDVDKDEAFFVQRNITDISGEYTVLLYGYSNSTYTLYVTDHKNKIRTVDDSAASCKAKAGERCLFKYDLFDWNINQNIIDDYYDYLITTDYLYGSGVISVRLVSGNKEDIFNLFPTTDSNDFNSIKTNSRNLLKFRYDQTNSKITNTSIILISVECREDCFFDLNILEWFDSSMQYLSLYQENIFYIYENQQKSVLVYYNSHRKDLVYNFYTYEGRANVTVYTNETAGVNNYLVKEIDKFTIDSGDSVKASYTKRINNNYDIEDRSVYFGVQPEKDLGFYVKLNYERDFNKLKMSKGNALHFSEDMKEYFGFFDMLDEFEYVILTVAAENPKASVTAHVKFLYVDKSAKEESSVLPDMGSADISGSTDPILNSLTMKINNPDRYISKKDTRFLRVLISLQYSDYSNNSQHAVTLTLSPSSNGLSTSEVAQDVYTFAQFKGVEAKIFDLKKAKPEDDLLVIELSTCSGDVDYKLSDTMNFNQKDIKAIDFKEDSSNGRKLLKVDLRKYTGENFYFTITNKEAGGKDCFYSANAYFCEDLTLAMFYYFTTNEEEYKRSFSNGKGSLEVDEVSEDSFAVSWRKILTQAKDKSIRQANATYTLFLSESLFDFNHMESVCYLSKMKQNATQVILIETDDWERVEITGLTSEKYFVNILAKNVDDNDVIAFQPVEVLLRRGGGMPGYLIALLVGLVLGLILLVCYFYRKFKITKQILNYEVNDVRNMSTVPKTLSEMRDLAIKSDRQRYTNLAEEVI